MVSVLDMLGFKEESMKHIENRLKTLQFWPVKFISKRDAAFSGFYYEHFAPSNDTLRCFYCKLALYKWEFGEIPIEEHKKWSKNCSRIKEMDEEPMFPRYELTHKRKSTFREWPIGLPVTSDDLARAGFFYRGTGDHCICYQCGKVLRNWVQGDDVWVEHIKWSPNCKHVMQMKGVQYVDYIKLQLEIKKNTNDSSLVSDLEDSFNSLSISDDMTCGVCYDGRKEMALVPCGHVFCAECSFNFKDCPTCRKNIQRKMRLYF